MLYWISFVAHCLLFLSVYVFWVLKRERVLKQFQGRVQKLIGQCNEATSANLELLEDRSRELKELVTKAGRLLDAQRNDLGKLGVNQRLLGKRELGASSLEVLKEGIQASHSLSGIQAYSLYEVPKEEGAKDTSTSVELLSSKERILHYHWQGLEQELIAKHLGLTLEEVALTVLMEMKKPK